MMFRSNFGDLPVQHGRAARSPPSRGVHVGRRPGDAAAGARPVHGPPAPLGPRGRGAAGASCAVAAIERVPIPEPDHRERASRCCQRAGRAGRRRSSSDIADLFGPTRTSGRGARRPRRQAGRGRRQARAPAGGAARRRSRQYRDQVDPDAQADAEAVGNIAHPARRDHRPDRGVGRHRLAEPRRRLRPRPARPAGAAPTSAGRSPKLFLRHAGDRVGRRADRDARRRASAAPRPLPQRVRARSSRSCGTRADARRPRRHACRAPSGSTLNTARDTSFLVVDGLIRGWSRRSPSSTRRRTTDADNVLGDVIVGWDAAALDVDSPARPTAADVVSGRMVSLALRRGGGDDDRAAAAHAGCTCPGGSARRRARTSCSSRSAAS